MTLTQVQADVLQQQTAKEAAERLIAGSTVAKQDVEQPEESEIPRVYSEEETLRNAVKAVERRGFADAAAALEMDFANAHAKDLAWAAEVLSEAMKATRPDGKWIFHSWVRDTMRTIKNRAREAANASADESAQRLFANFLESVSRAIESARGIRRAPEFAKPRMLENAKRFFQRAEDTRWLAWALQAVERMIAGCNNPVAELLRSDSEIATAVSAAPERRKASALIDTLKERAQKAIASVHLGPMRPGKTERDRAKRKPS